MTEHCFGHDSWTEHKLDALGRYLIAWRKIFTSNPKAQHFKTLYIDAFAGTGSRKNPVPARNDLQHDLFPDHEFDVEIPDDYRRGSARIALDLASPFDQYVFVEKNADRAAELSRMIEEDFPALKSRCRVLKADGCDVLREICVTHKNWKHWRAVAFIDPYGMNVEGNLLRIIGMTEAIDVWLLFPLGMGVNRLLTSGGLPPKQFADKLTRVFGDTDWKKDFYRTPLDGDLFPELPASAKKQTDFEIIGERYRERLRGWFAAVAPHSKVLRNSKGNPMFWLFFAAANPKGAPTAVNIADYLMKD